MDTSYPDENARLSALLQEQQTTIRKMAEYNRLLLQRVARYASEINRLKALVAQLQRMQFGKSSEKLREKTQRQVREAEERISALQEEMAEEPGSGKTRTARLWVQVRDDRNAGSQLQPAVWFA